MALMSYKCPNCGGGLVFDPDSQKFQCEYCLSEFTEEEMKRMEEASASPAEEEKAVLEEEGTAPQEGDSSQSPETGEAAVYTCPSCGAQIVTDATTAASFCYYCHNPVVFSGRLSGDHMPDFVIPRNKNTACLDADKVVLPLTVRKWRQGDKFVPFGMKGKKKVSDYLTDRKFSLFQKENQYVVCSADRIVWLVGERSDDRFRVTEDTKRVLIIRQLEDK